MSTFSDLRAGLATRLQTITVNGAALRVENFVPDVVNPPCAIVTPNTVGYDTAFGRGSDDTNFSVMVVVGRQSERVAQSLLDDLCDSAGAMSVKAAIEGDRTLGGACMDCRVTDLTSYGSLVRDDATYLAATFSVHIITD